MGDGIAAHLPQDRHQPNGAARLGYHTLIAAYDKAY